MDFPKLSPVFTKCSLLYSNIPVGEDHIVCISWLWTIVDIQSGFQFLIPIPDNFSAEQCTATFNTHVVPTMGCLHCIVFDPDTFFMCLHFQSWAASKGIKLEASTAYHSQTNGQSEIVNKEIIEVARACRAEGNKWWSKILEIQPRLNSHYNASCRHNSFATVLGFDIKLGLHIFSHPINKYQPAMEGHKATCQAMTSAKASQTNQANLHHTLKTKHKVGDKVLFSTKNININNISPKMKPH